MRQISEEPDIHNNWTPYEKRILISKWDKVVIPDEVSDEECENIAIDFCKKLETELHRDWEDIKEQLDTYCQDNFENSSQES